MPAKKDRANERMIHIWIPEPVHKRMRLKVAELDTTIQHWVSSLISESLKSGKKGVRK